MGAATTRMRPGSLPFFERSGLVRGPTHSMPERVLRRHHRFCAPDPAGQAWQLWIGYALRREMWGRGLATEVVTELVRVGEELGLPVWAETFAGNIASQRVLEKAGLELVDEVVAAGRLCRIFRSRR
ncbi:GNAT family N-acetyltransferase [Kocuria sp. KH4]